MTGHILRAELSLSDSIDLKLVARSGAAESLLIDIEYDGSDVAGAVVRVLERFIRDARSYERVTVRLPCHGPGRAEEALEACAAALRERTYLSSPDLRFLVQEAGTASVVLRWTHAEFVLMGREAVVDERESEIRTLIGYYGAFYSGPGVRFILPSGGEASSFLLTADVLQSQRDCRVIALWCLDALVSRLPDSLRATAISLLIDTPGLLPLCYEIWRLSETSRCTPGRITVAPSYPHAGGEVASLVRTAVASADILLCIISASATGAMSSLFARGFERVLGSSRGAVVALAVLEGATLDEEVSSLCTLKQDSKTDLGAATSTVRVEPSSMRFLPWESSEFGAAVIPPDDQRTERWLDFVSRREAVGLECLPHSRRELVRPRSGLMAFRLLADRFSIRGQELAKLVDNSEFAPLRGSSRLVVVLPDDLEVAGGEQAIRTFLQALDIEVEAVISVQKLPDYAGKNPVLCFAWGSVTGQSAAELFRIAKRVTSERVDLALLYLRPPSRNDLAMLRRVVGDAHLAVGWQVLLPWSSAFEPEALVLSDYLDSGPAIGADLRALALHRLNVISPIGADQDWEARKSRFGAAASQLLWCDDDPASDGWMQNTPTLLLAAASELASRRSQASTDFRIDLKSSIEGGASPRWIAALLRQTLRGEIVYWTSSRDRSDGTDFVADFVLADRPERDLLLAELLCAGILGKIPDDLIGTVVNSVEQELSSEVISGQHSAAIRLILDIHRWSRGE